MTDFRSGADRSELPPIVLIVEDDRDTREMYEALLQAEGFWVMKVADAVEAFEYAKDFHPDAVLTDLGLAGDFDGAGFIRHLRAEPEFQFTPIIAVTGRQPPELPSLRGLGISAVLLKPVSPGTLIERIESAMQQSALLRARSKAILERIPVLVEQSQTALRRSADAARLRRQRRCPVCQQPLVWFDRKRLPPGRHDYYDWCEQGCGFFRFNVRMQTFQRLAPGNRRQRPGDASPRED
jgi:DNA-binding response OmpR family regulator